MSLRSPLGRVLGLGSAKSGAGHWWAQRVTAVALVPLGLWFLISLLALPAIDEATVRAWLASPASAAFACLLVGVLGYHALLGVSVVVEDYVHAPGLRIASLLGLRFGFALAGAAALLAILKVALGH